MAHLIIQAIVNLFCNIIILAINSIGTFVSLPLSAAYSISQYTSFFTYLVGNDLIVALIGTLTFWFVVKTGFGVVLFIWRLLPFT